MRAARVLATLALVLALGGTVPGQTPPYDATIVAPEVEVRSGPSPQYYATSKLHRGDRVRVVPIPKDNIFGSGAQDGWLAIEPPPGSFSWISARVVDRQGAHAVVLALEGAPVRVGSSLTDQPPSVEQTKLERGAQVVVLGDHHVADEGSKWWPIQPQKEVRFLPKDAVKLTPAVETVAAAPGGAPKPPGLDPLWLQAEQAQNAGNVAAALSLYEECKQKTTDPDLKVACLNRLEQLRQGNRASVPPNYRQGLPTEASTGDSRLTAVPANYPPQPTQAVSYAPPPAPSAMQTTNPGWLRRAGFPVDGRQAYVLEDRLGHPLLFVSPQAGVNLEAFIGRNVTLTGAIVYRGDLRNYHITAVQVAPMP